MRFTMNSLEALRGVFGINQLASRMFTSAEDLSCCRASGVTSKGASEPIDLATYCTLHARGRRTEGRVRNAENMSVRRSPPGHLTSGCSCRTLVTDKDALG